MKIVLCFQVGTLCIDVIKKGSRKHNIEKKIFVKFGKGVLKFQ